MLSGSLVIRKYIAWHASRLHCDEKYIAGYYFRTLCLQKVYPLVPDFVADLVPLFLTLSLTLSLTLPVP